MRRTIIIIVLVGALAVAGFLFWRQQQAGQATAVEILREAVVTHGRITATVNATGSIEPESLVTLTFGMAGTIRDVNVVRGQVVQVGDVLAELNAAELALAVQQAEDALYIQQLTRQQRQDSTPTVATLAAAQADIDAAQASLLVAGANLAGAQAAVLQARAQKAQLLAGPTAGQIAAAEAQLTAAQAQQVAAQTTYNKLLECVTFELPDGSTQETCPGLGEPEEQGRFNLNNANASLAAARANLADLQSGARASDVQAADAVIASAQANVQAAEGNVAVAEANVARAEAAYARLLEPPAANELAILEAQIASAQTNLALAELRLSQARIVAPMAGTVANVLIHAGEQTSPGAPAITVVNEGAFHITVNVDEIDIAQIAVGQSVDITLDALPDVVVDGVIVEIAPTSGSAGGVVTYVVTINIDPDAGVTLRAGMSANASIVVQEIENVLTVPNWAVRLNRETGAAFVQVKRADGVIAEMAVTTGLRNELFSEVLSGLSAGDVVVVTNIREAFSLFNFGN
ncbi:MAG: efflux RND transporter periplasmic adaptor subunit [Anaerolinea sp.]|nr:efflux RND transporter periplasmic adaptor subunit [Anaerolinea sp.]